MYKLWDKNIKNIKLLKKEINNFKNSINKKDLWKWLSESILWINEILILIEKNNDFLKNNLIFKKFLKNLINEVIDEYLKIFKYLENRIKKIEVKTEAEKENINSEYKKFYDILINKNISNKLQEINNLKKKIASLKIN